MSGWAKEDRIPQSASGGSVGCGIFLPKVRFDFYDAGGETNLIAVSNQDFPEKFSCDMTGMAREKCPIQGLDRMNLGRALG
ncbi:hypothetical protein Q8G39_28320, partial [Klebsiella pneumoniae]